MYGRLHDWLVDHGLGGVAVAMEIARAPFVLGLREGISVWWYLIRTEVKEVVG